MLLLCPNSNLTAVTPTWDRFRCPDLQDSLQGHPGTAWAQLRAPPSGIGALPTVPPRDTCPSPRAVRRHGERGRNLPQDLVGSLPLHHGNHCCLLPHCPSPSTREGAPPLWATASCLRSPPPGTDTPFQHPGIGVDIGFWPRCVLSSCDSPPLWPWEQNWGEGRT